MMISQHSIFEFRRKSGETDRLRRYRSFQDL